MASEMRVACVLCASHPCVRGGLPRPLPCVHSAVESPLSILLATSDRSCVSAVGGVARGTAWRGAERVRGSLVAPVRRERPWARFHKHKHPPKRSHCHIRPTLDTGHCPAGARARPRRQRGPGERDDARARANRRETAARRTRTGADHSPTGTPAPLERG